MSRVRVLVADDSPLARQAIISILDGAPELEVVGEAEDGFQAVELTRALQPDLVLLDINMPRCDGLLATRLIKRERPGLKVVILTVSDDPRDLFAAIQAGAQGYLLKNLQPDDWLEYLRGLVRGDWEVPRAMAGRILAEFAAPQALGAAEAEAVLTPREQEVLALVAQACSNKEIAARLFISEQTVKNHIKHMLEKLNLKNRVELALYARRTRAGRNPDEEK